MNILSLVLAIGAGLLFLGGIFQGIVAGIELTKHAVGSGQVKKWSAIILTCIVLAVISGYASYASSSKSDTSSSLSSNTTTPNTISSPTAAPSPTPTTAAPTPTTAAPTPTTAPEAEIWIGTSTEESSLIYTRYAELHVVSFGQTASFQGIWCEDYTGKTDLYGHSVCTDSMPISGTWVAFSKLGAGLQADINNRYPYTTHATIIIWGGQGGLDQGGHNYAFVQNNELKGLGYSANGSGPYASFSLTLQGSGTSKLGN